MKTVFKIFTKRPVWLSVPSLCLLLGACAGQPPVEPAATPPPRNPDDVELTLNLPEQGANCDCATAAGLEDKDHTFLERGVQRLAGGEYIEAVQYFQRYQRLEKAPLAQWESRVAIAYVSMLPDSPFYDVLAAREAYGELKETEPTGQKHSSIVLMTQALETFVVMERHVDYLESRAALLQEDLDKREQALKRLRELTLGQPAG